MSLPAVQALLAAAQVTQPAAQAAARLIQEEPAAAFPAHHHPAAAAFPAARAVLDHSRAVHHEAAARGHSPEVVLPAAPAVAAGRLVKGRLLIVNS